MYKIQLLISNPQTAGSKMLVRQFDPALMTQAKWNSAFPAVKTEIDALVAESAQPNVEPAVW